MIPISDSLIRDVLSEYGIGASADLCDKVRTYVGLLLRWNKKIGLTTVTEPKEVLQRHFGESFFAADAAQIEFGRLADVGSGAGFPGLALKLIRSDLEVMLIESNVKKGIFLREVIRELDLHGIEVVSSRAQDIGAELEDVNLVTARAVGYDAELLGWSRRHLLREGRVVLWLGTSGTERVILKDGWKWEPPILIPHSERRFLVIGRVVRSTN
ncbi:MAG: 16S rRNA (guanine(527)-N(7))-methyltransferase RsmG [Candidatus Acidiferrales bacterium]